MSNVGVSANRLELLQIARSVADEKSIPIAIVLENIEAAIQKAARAKYGAELDVKAKIDSATGEISLEKRMTVVADEALENESAQLTLEDAKKTDPEAEIGKVYIEGLPLFEMGRVMSQTGKQVITQGLREAERERQFGEFKDRVGEIVNGIVKRVEYGNVIVDLGRAEGVIRRSDGIPRESFQQGDRVRSFIYDVRRETRGPQIFLSRAHPKLMAALFSQEVPEVYDGVIEIPAVARDPGSRAKIAVRSNDSSIDPVGACVGMRGSRVQAVVSELAGEKIDIIPWNADAATFIVNALQPAEVSKVVLDEDEERIEVVVPDDQLSLAIGRRGQNVRLASQLTGWSIDIITETEESERRQKEFAERTTLFIDSLDVDEVVAQLLVTEGFESIDEIAYIDLDEIAAIEGFDEETAVELQARAKEHLEKIAAELDAKRKELGVDDAVVALDGVTGKMAVRFGEKDVKTLEDLAGLTPDDLRGWYESRDGARVREEGVLEGFNMPSEDAEDLILRARVAAGWITQEDYEAAIAPSGIEDLDAEARAEAESLIAAEQLLKNGGDGAAGKT
jgi:N utilization substance protein A